MSPRSGEEGEWIPVEARLPPPLTDVLVAYLDALTGELEVDLGYRGRGDAAWFLTDGALLPVGGRVTHWKPLPHPLQ